MSVSIDDMNSLLGGTSIDPSALLSSEPTLNASNSGLLGDLGDLASGILGIGGTAAEYGVAESSLNKTQEQNQQLAQQLESIGQPYYSEGTNLLSSYSSGQLTGPYQTEYQAAAGANQQTATSQEQQVAQMLAGSSGGQNIEGAEASQTQQIQGQQNLANQQALANAFAQELSSSESLGSLGGNYISQGITNEMTSNTQLSAQMQQLMAALAQSSSGSLGSSFGSLLSGIGGLVGFL